MRKTIFSRLMAVFLVMSLLSTTAFAAECLNTRNDDDTGYKYITDSGELLGYDDNGTISYDYYLNDNLELEKTLRIETSYEDRDTDNRKIVTIDLSGYDIIHTGVTGSVIYVNNSTLTIKDTSDGENGKITGGNNVDGEYTYGGGISGATATIYLKGGNITGNTAEAGGGIGGNGGHYYMSGGSITDNTATDRGGGIYDGAGATFEMTGGIVTGNTAARVFDGIHATYPKYEGTVVVCGNGNRGQDISFYNHGEWNTFESRHHYSDPTCAKDSACVGCGEAGTEKATGNHTEVLSSETAATYDAPGARVYTCSGCGEVMRTEEIPQLVRPAVEPTDEPTDGTTDVTIPDVTFTDGIGGGDGTGAAGATGTTISDEEVPLAGLMTYGELLAYLYDQAGSPDGEDAEGEYTKAAAWAYANEIGDEEIALDDAVTVIMLREALAGYAAYAGMEITVEIEGEDDDVVMNCGEILAEVFEK